MPQSRRTPARVLALAFLAALAGPACDPDLTTPTVGTVFVSPARVLMTVHGDTRALAVTVLGPPNHRS